MTKIINSTGQRAQAMETAYFADIQAFNDKLYALRLRDGKTARQWRIDCRLAHALERQQRAAIRPRYAALGSIADYVTAGTTRLNNSKFRVTGLSVAALDGRKRDIGKNVDGSIRTEREYTRDKTALDKQARKRGKN